MSFWERDVNDSFERMFDFNRDGKLDIFEDGMLYEYVDHGFRSSDGAAAEDDEDEDDDIFSDEF